MLVIAAFAVVVYGLFWLVERRRAKNRPGRAPARPAGPRTPPKRTSAPDDDEEFLRQLEQRRRRAAREEQSKKRPEDEGKSKRDQSRPE